MRFYDTEGGRGRGHAGVVGVRGHRRIIAASGQCSYKSLGERDAEQASLGGQGGILVMRAASSELPFFYYSTACSLANLQEMLFSSSQEFG